MCARVRLEPVLARRTQHVPDDAEHRREELVPGGVADDLVETDVLFHVRLVREDLPLLLHEQVLQLGELQRVDPRGRERGDRRLDDAAELDDVTKRVTAGDERLERLREIVRRDLANERAAAGARLDDAEELESTEGLTDRCPGDLELLRKGALGGELVSGVELTLLEE
jgi:hypothetical protein